MTKKASVLVSVVIANKNGEKFLERCLDSVLVEKGNFEVIVVDDGSDLAVSLGGVVTLGKVKVIRLDKSVGAAEARNVGVKNSTGKYVLFLDVGVFPAVGFILWGFRG